MINVTNSILQSVTSADATLGVMKSRIDDQADYVSKLSDAIKISVGNLVDTNMEEASARQTCASDRAADGHSGAVDRQHYGEQGADPPSVELISARRGRMAAAADIHPRTSLASYGSIVMAWSRHLSGRRSASCPEGVTAGRKPEA